MAPATLRYMWAGLRDEGRDVGVGCAEKESGRRSVKTEPTGQVSAVFHEGDSGVSMWASSCVLACMTGCMYEETSVEGGDVLQDSVGEVQAGLEWQADSRMCVLSTT